MLKIIEVETTKYGERRICANPSLLIIHSIGMPLTTSLEMLTSSSREISVHYLIAPDGTVYAMVPENMRAWHAGKSYWRGQTDVNSLSIGIELAWSLDKEAHEEDLPGPFPDEQMDALVELCKGIQARWGIKPENVLAHSDVAPSRKRDPGERFDWGRMEAEGLALLPHRPYPLPSTGDVTPLLARLGYDVIDPKAALIAFQRHYRQRDCCGIADSETRSMIEWLLKRLER